MRKELSFYNKSLNLSTIKQINEVTQLSDIDEESLLLNKYFKKLKRTGSSKPRRRSRRRNGSNPRPNKKKSYQHMSYKNSLSRLSQVMKIEEEKELNQLSFELENPKSDDFLLQEVKKPG
jgi:hypothetical protein